MCGKRIEKTIPDIPIPFGLFCSKFLDKRAWIGDKSRGRKSFWWQYQLVTSPSAWQGGIYLGATWEKAPSALKWQHVIRPFNPNSEGSIKPYFWGRDFMSSLCWMFVIAINAEDIKVIIRLNMRGIKRALADSIYLSQDWKISMGFVPNFGDGIP